MFCHAENSAGSLFKGRLVNQGEDSCQTFVRHRGLFDFQRTKLAVTFQDYINFSGITVSIEVKEGFASGVLGVVVTWLLCIPINAIIRKLTDIKGLNAFLDIRVALLLIGISMLLTLIAGVIPSRSASRKNPVVALRTE